MKILGCDYDGTLNFGGIGQEKLKMIEKWRQAGHKLGVVSGRGPDLMAFVQKEFGLRLDFLAAFNGGIILNERQEILFEADCKEVDLAELVQDLFAWGCEFAHVNSDKYYLVQRSEENLKEGEYLLKNLTCPRLLYQVSVVLDGVDEAAKTVKRIAEKYGAFLTPLQNERCIDIVPKGVSKADGVRRIAEWYAAQEKDIIVVGDNFNDIDMLKTYKSYAMENGVAEVKKAALFTTKSVTDLIEKELREENLGQTL